MALNEATLPLILYRKVKNIEHVIIVRTTCHISCFFTFLASAIPTPFFFFYDIKSCVAHECIRMIS